MRSACFNMRLTTCATVLHKCVHCWPRTSHSSPALDSLPCRRFVKKDELEAYLAAQAAAEVAGMPMPPHVPPAAVDACDLFDPSTVFDDASDEEMYGFGSF